MTALDLVTGLKSCSKCKEDKTSVDFNHDKTRQDGLFSWCRKCSSADKVKQYQADPEKARAYRRAAYSRHAAANPERVTKKHMINSSRKRALEIGIPHAIDVEDIHIPECCPIGSCGLQFTYEKDRVRMSSPSLDRYDPKLGYVPGNIWIICLGCNRRKQDMSGEGHLIFGQELIESFSQRPGGV